MANRSSQSYASLARVLANGRTFLAGDPRQVGSGQAPIGCSLDTVASKKNQMDFYALKNVLMDLQCGCRALPTYLPYGGEI